MLEEACERAETAALVQRAIAPSPSPMRAITEDKIAYLPCVTCREPMTRRNFGGSSGVLLDVCKDHGIWLDSDEFERVLDFVRGGGLERARERERLREAQRAEQRHSNIPSLPISENRSEGWTAGRRSDVDVIDVLGGLLRMIWRS